MPQWTIPRQDYDLPRNIAFLDTNVLVALFNPNDNLHSNTMAAIDLGCFRWAVTHATLIEAWNFLGAKVRRPELAHEMVVWLLTPGNAILLSDQVDRSANAHHYSKHFRIDIVDAFLVDMANRITNECNIFPAVHVATYDAGDFLRLFGGELAFNVYDMRDLSSTTGADYTGAD